MIQPRTHPAQPPFFRVLALAVTLTLMLAGCASLSGAPPDEVAVPTLPPATATPEPDERGIGDTLRLFYWEAPTLLNPHLTVAVKDWEASRLVYEPLASFDADGTMVPFLAAEIPSLENGDVAADGSSVTWRLKQGVQWSDGEPFTADDVRFTFEYITNPAIGTSSAATYELVENVDVLDAYTIQVNFTEPTPAWVLPFVGSRGVIIPEHIFADYNGPNAREAPANNRPVGTGPYQVVSAGGIVPQETLFLGSELIETNLIVFEPNERYRDPQKPYFSRVELRGGGTPVEAARRVFQERDADYAYNLTIDADALATYADLGLGEPVLNFGSNVELIELNHTNPYTAAANGERSSLEVPHPFFDDLRVRQAFAHAINRAAISEIYGDTGRPTSNILVSPPAFDSPNTPFYPYDLDRARALLDEAGWVDSNGDGVRDKDGQDLSILFQTGRTPARVEILRTLQQSLQEIGFDVELKYVDISVFYGGDAATNPDKAVRFLADAQEWDIISVSPDPGVHMSNWLSSKVPQQANNWSAGFIGARWASPAYDALHSQANAELDPEQRRELFIELNDMLIREVVVIPVATLARVSGVSTTLTGFAPTPWDSDTWNIQDWRRAE